MLHQMYAVQLWQMIFQITAFSSFDYYRELADYRRPIVSSEREQQVLGNPRQGDKHLLFSLHVFRCLVFCLSRFFRSVQTMWFPGSTWDFKLLFFANWKN